MENLNEFFSSRAIVISIRKEIGKIAVSIEEGNHISEKINHIMKTTNKTIHLNFDGLDFYTNNFLRTVFDNLVWHHPVSVIKDRIKTKGLKAGGLNYIERVMQVAYLRCYHSDDFKMQKGK